MKPAVIIISSFLLAAQSHAASFDCTKASTNVEHIICDNPELSKLDGQVSRSYAFALRGRSNPDAIKRSQLDWLHARNRCSDVACVRSAYVSRISALAPSAAAETSRVPPVLSEEANARRVRMILSRNAVALRPGYYSDDDIRYCSAFLKDFKQNRGIEYLKPVLRTTDYNNSELAKLRNQCPMVNWTPPPKCDPHALAIWLKGYETDRQGAQKKANHMCDELFGTDEFALYEIDLGDHKEHALSNSRAPQIYPEELGALLRTPAKTGAVDPSIWARRTNTVINVFFTGEGISAMDYSECRQNKLHDLWLGGATLPEAYSGLIKYGDAYLSYNLERLDRTSQHYYFSVGGRKRACRFDVSKPGSGRR